MGSASYILGIRDPDGLTAAEIAIDRIDGHITVYDEGDVDWTVRLFPGALPPTGQLPVFDENDVAWLVDLTPILLVEDTLKPAAATIDPNWAPNPGILDSAASMAGLAPSVGFEPLAIAPDEQDSPAAVVTPAIDKGTIAIAPATLDSPAAAIDPAAVTTTTGTIAPATLDSQAAVVAPPLAPEFKPIARVLGAAMGSAAAAVAPAAIAQTAQTISPPTILGGARTIEPSGPTFVSPAAGQAVVDSAASALAPRRIMGTAHRTPDVSESTASVVAPAGVDVPGPPTTGITTNSAAALIAPTLQGIGTVDAGTTTGSAAAAIAPTISHGPTTRAPAMMASAAALVTPTLTGAKESAQAAPASSSAAVLEPGVRMGLPMDGVTDSSAAVLEPTITLETTITPATLDSSSSVPTPDVDSPLVLITPDVVDSQTAAIAPAAPAFAPLAIAPTPAISSATANRVGLLHGEESAQFTLQSTVTTHIDYTAEVDLIPTAQQNQEGLKIDMPMFDSDGAPLSLEGASDVYVWLRPPSGESKRRIGVVLGEPSNGVVRYESAPSDLHEHGLWGIQVSAVLDDGRHVWSKVEVFRALPNLGPAPHVSNAPQASSITSVLQPSISWDPTPPP